MAGGKYKMVALDLDGTLLGPDHRISDESVAYLRELHRKGFLVAIATGRSPASCADVIVRLDCLSIESAAGGFPLVCLNGASCMIVRKSGESGSSKPSGPVALQTVGVSDDSLPSNAMLDGRLVQRELFHEPVPVDVAVKTLGLAKGLGLVTNYYVGSEIYAQPLDESHRKITRRYSDLTGTPIGYVDDDYSAAMGRGMPSKLVVFCETGVIDEVCRKLSDALHGEAHVIRGSPPFFVEVLNTNVCKGKGLERMCQSLGIDLHECIAFGDGDNDREFIQLAGVGYAMKNARDAVKAIADRVTKLTNAEDGAIRTLQEMESDGQLHFPGPGEG